VKNNGMDDLEESKQHDRQQNSLMESSLQNKGEIAISDTIKFESVPILSPNGDTLVPAMSFEI